MSRENPVSDPQDTRSAKVYAFSEVCFQQWREADLPFYLICAQFSVGSEEQPLLYYFIYLAINS